MSIDGKLFWEWVQHIRHLDQNYIPWNKVNKYVGHPKGQAPLQVPWEYRFPLIFFYPNPISKWSSCSFTHTCSIWLSSHCPLHSQNHKQISSSKLPKWTTVTKSHNISQTAKHTRNKTSWIIIYSIRFKIKVTFGHKLRYKIKVTCGEISLKLRQTNWNVAMFNVNVVVDELPSQITITLV